MMFNCYMNIIRLKKIKKYYLKQPTPNHANKDTSKQLRLKV